MLELRNVVVPPGRLEAVWKILLRWFATAATVASVFYLLRYFVFRVVHIWPLKELDVIVPFITAPAVGAVVSVVWTWKWRRHDEKIHFVLQYLIRFALTPLLIMYGMSKILGGQFYPSFPSTLDSTVSELDGAALTWAYYGRSYAYTVFIAVSQLGAALLLFSRRTQLLGALLVMTIFANITFINHAYDVGVVIRASFVIFVGALYLVVADAPRLIALFWGGEARPARAHPYGRMGRLFVCVHVALVLAWMIPHHVRAVRNTHAFNHSQTMLHGIWQVERASVESTSPEAMRLASWTKIYFDDARVVAWERTARDRLKRFGGLREADVLRTTEYWIEPDGRFEIVARGASGVTTFRGTYTLAGNALRLEGTIDGKPATLLLERGAARPMGKSHYP